MVVVGQIIPLILLPVGPSSTETAVEPGRAGPGRSASPTGAAPAPRHTATASADISRLDVDKRLRLLLLQQAACRRGCCAIAERVFFFSVGRVARLTGLRVSLRLSVCVRACVFAYECVRGPESCTLHPSPRQAEALLSQSLPSR